MHWAYYTALHSLKIETLYIHRVGARLWNETGNASEMK